MDKRGQALAHMPFSPKEKVDKVDKDENSNRKEERKKRRKEGRNCPIISIVLDVHRHVAVLGEAHAWKGEGHDSRKRRSR